MGWLLAELEQRFGYGLDELARRFDRSVSWVSRRLALVEVAAGSDPAAGARGQDRGAGGDEVSGAGGAPKPGGLPADGGRSSPSITAIRGEAGQLYAAWRKGSPAIRKRILDDPELFFKTQRQAQEKAPAGTGAELMRDLEMVVAIVNRAQRRLAGAAATELDHQQRESRAAADRAD